jgi:hypothetical protein
MIRLDIPIEIPSRKSCACGEHGTGSVGVMPSMGVEEGSMDRSEVVWVVRATVGRKGLMKRDVK